MSNKKTDCFGYSKECNGCVVLDETCCKDGPCGFYKKKGELCNGCPSVNTLECVKCKAARTSLPR